MVYGYSDYIRIDVILIPLVVPKWHVGQVLLIGQYDYYAENKKQFKRKIGGLKMKLGIAQIIILACQFIGLGAHIVKHGEPYKEKYNGWAKAIAVALTIWLLYWGGFFN